MMTVVTFILLTSLGYLLFSFWEDEFPFFAERLSLGFLLGIGFVTLEMFILGLLKIPLSPKNIISPLFLLTGFVFLLSVAKRKFKLFPLEGVKIRKTSLIEKVLVALLFFLVGWSFLQTIVWPPVTWDTIALYDFRALRFTETRSLAQEIFTKEPELATYTYSYPFFTSLAHALVYITGGANPKFIYTLFYATFLIVFYHTLKRICSRSTALLFTTLVATSQSYVYHSTIAYANLPHAVYFALSTIFLWQWLDNKKQGFVLASTFFLGLSTWVRSGEPFWMINLGVLILYFLSQRKYFSIVFHSSIFFAIRQLWGFYYNAVLKDIYDPSFIKLSFKLDITKFLPVTFFFFKRAIFVKEWVFVLLAFILAVLLERQQVKKYWHIPVFVFGYFALLWVGIYYYSVNYPWWDRIGGSATRITFFSVPLLVYGCVFFLFNRLSPSRRLKSILKGILEIEIFYE